MPYAIEHNHGTKTYRVVNIETGHVLAHNSTLKHAQAQVRLLHDVAMEKYTRGRMSSKLHETRENNLNRMSPEARSFNIKKVYEDHHGKYVR